MNVRRWSSLGECAVKMIPIEAIKRQKRIDNFYGGSVDLVEFVPTHARAHKEKHFSRLDFIRWRIMALETKEN